MKKRIKLTSFLLAVFLVFTFVGCTENEDFIVYGRFQDNYTTDRFEVFCDWETINPLLDICDANIFPTLLPFHCPHGFF